MRHLSVLVKADGAVQVLGLLAARCSPPEDYEQEWEVDLAAVRILIEARMAARISPHTILIPVSWEAWVDEDAGLTHRPLNEKATDLARQAGWDSGFQMLLGDVLFTGQDVRTGEPADVPSSLLVAALGLEVPG